MHDALGSNRVSISFPLSGDADAAYLTDLLVPASLCVVLHVVCWIADLSCRHPLTLRRRNNLTPTPL